MDEQAWKLDDYSLRPLPPPAHSLVEPDDIESHDYCLAITGDIFRWMINHAPLETLQRVSHLLRDMSCILLKFGYIDAGQDPNLRTHVAR